MDPVSKAQTSPQNSQKAAKRVPPIGRRFQPGQSGNPGGRPKKKPITEIYEKILASGKNQQAIEETVVKLILGGRMASVLQLREMAERVEGKVAQEVNMEVTGKLTLEQVLQARKKSGK